jgi:hypothetical protein
MSRAMILWRGSCSPCISETSNSSLSSIFRHEIVAHYERVVYHEMKDAYMCRLTQRRIPRVWDSQQNGAAIDHREGNGKVMEGGGAASGVAPRASLTAKGSGRQISRSGPDKHLWPTSPYTNTEYPSPFQRPSVKRET